MEERGNNANKVLLTVIGIAVLVVATIGATFAYFSATGGTATQNVQTGELKVAATSSLTQGKSIKPTAWSSTITENDANADIAKVGLSVVTDGTTISTGVYKVSLTTTGIALNDTDGKTGGALSDVKWALYEGETEKATGDFTSGNATNLELIKNVAIPAGTNTDNYTLYIWIENKDSQQDQLQGLTITAKLVVDAAQEAQV